MSGSDLRGLLGIAGPWIAPLAAVLFMGIVLAAFRQGRAISIWPPRIGPRLSAPAFSGRPEMPPRGLVGADGAAPVDREYGVDRARDFYQEIARSYDLRNSGNLVSTHLATVAQLQAIRSRCSTLRVLDLGGGTGKLIAVHFFNDQSVWWTYVDSCPAMATEFRRNLAGYPLGRNSEIVPDDLARAVRQLKPASYDVVMLSLVLSSMPTPPDFAPIARLLSPGGSLIVTDINPGYTRDNPLYKVPVDGAVVALRTTPVDPFEVIRRAHVAGLRPTEQQTLGEGQTYYSFMTVFAPAAAHPYHERDDDGLVRA
jgi:ubiquinone/menaquinone biosynthesis C-methylase UbiE